VVGVDVGGSKIVSGLVGPEDGIAHRHRRDVPASRIPAEVIEAIAESIEAVRRLAPRPPVAVGVGIAGQVERGSGRVLHAPNLRWKNVPFRSVLAERVGLPVVAGNDVRTITLGEWQFGAGRGCANLLCVFIGTGVGGGVVADGRLLEGAIGAAGELGHVTLVADGRACHCPNRGCLEAYVGGWAIEERVNEEARADPVAARALYDLAGGPGHHLLPISVERAARQGDPFSVRFIERLAEEFASGLVGLVNAFNPERVVVGGKIAEGFPELVHSARRAVLARCQPPVANAEVVPSSLGADAGILGAALMARTVSPVGSV
jgi:glucokinase